MVDSNTSLDTDWSHKKEKLARLYVLPLTTLQCWCCNVVLHFFFSRHLFFILEIVASKCFSDIMAKFIRLAVLVGVC